MLQPEQKKVWVGGVESISDAVKLGLQGSKDDDANARVDRAAWWKFERLHWVREYLDGNSKVFYEEMREKYGEPGMADVNVRMTSWRRGCESPVTVEELKSQSFPESVKRVESWRPI